jgi:exodeoxyribonuclease VII large subunit
MPYSDGTMSRPLFEPPLSRPRQVLTVTQLNLRLRETLQQAFPSVWVSGEISDLARPRSGHVYLTLKDDQGQLRAVIWRGVASQLPFDLEDGMEVICEGNIDVYPPRGSYQLIIRQLEPKGVGALQLALVRLRERLAAEGLFEAARKRPLPRFPRRVAVVTSPTGAAIRDFLEVLRRRWQGNHVLVLPTRVQGAEAAEEIVRAIQRAQTLRPLPDVLVVTRGGGSLEDLWCFNDERVVRAIAAATMPVVSAIGHEIDVTLSDLAADVRALTPSEAAERVSPSKEDVRAELEGLSRLLVRLLERKLQIARARVDALAARAVLSRPEERLRDLARRLDDWEARLHQSLLGQLRQARQRLLGLAGRLEALSPLAVLGRGYSLTQRHTDGKVIRSAEEVSSGELIRTRLAAGELISQVRERTESSSRPGGT